MVLDNKFGITNSAELARVEEKTSKKKAIKMYETSFLHTLEAGTFKTLSLIPDYLFEDIYGFSGKIRDVNIAKGNFRFAPVIYLKEALQQIEKMPQSTYKENIEKYVEMNIAHSFKQGNGRSMRIWLENLLKKK